MSSDNFKPRAVAEFLTGPEPYKFEIPSFQRGYRWMPKQVKDLLKDLYEFANGEAGNAVYYLQPLVVRGEGRNWQVLDGQQRLTTLKLILEAMKEFLSESKKKTVTDYELTYTNRPELNFNSPDSHSNLDSYFLSNAKKTIDDWKTKLVDKGDEDKIEQMANVLYGKGRGLSDGKTIKFIWYEAEGEDITDAGSIAIFNRLNRGKIKLTPSELIKALLIISADTAKTNTDSQTVLSMEWNEMERQFMRDKFFAFINAGNKKYDTRTDLLFNYLARSKGAVEKDDDFAYRWLQKQYDDYGAEKILEIWEKDVKAVYDLLLQWYSDVEMYNLIGFLSQCGTKIDEIHHTLETEKKKNGKGQWKKADNVKVLRKLCVEKFPSIKNLEKNIIPYPEAINFLDYGHNLETIRKTLLLFNSITYSKLKQRFPFERYADEKWDIEHVDSQTENPLTKNEDQFNWLKYSKEILEGLKSKNPEVEPLLKEIEATLNDTSDSSKWSSQYKSLYEKIISLDLLKPTDPVEDKDAIGNLTLLDSGTNRGYGNALFPYKRKCIVEREKEGEFVPACTRNVFLKYYSGDKGIQGNSLMKWNDDDAKAYLEAIHDALDPLFPAKPTQAESSEA